MNSNFKVYLETHSVNGKKACSFNRYVPLTEELTLEEKKKNYTNKRKSFIDSTPSDLENNKPKRRRNEEEFLKDAIKKYTQYMSDSSFLFILPFTKLRGKFKRVIKFTLFYIPND